jgi:hypothetical protein
MEKSEELSHMTENMLFWLNSPFLGMIKLLLAKSENCSMLRYSSGQATECHINILFSTHLPQQL